ncbi:MAG: FAD-dependent 5-carboxymethylaminomethyl-2-thiouridine(34) oxidoreductase MnmC [Hyphomicrobiales bacterium]|nr:FAD-dependent 5-carboxymethylaminomethyl-2-thiouridine(34) oxidoreductase MnmC [Hyphomicrobiales bacterium]
MTAPPAPWFRRPDPLPAGTRVAVVGGGVAGAAAARALARGGARVVVLERHGVLAAEASGNPAGIIAPRLTRDGGAGGRFHDRAFRHALDLMDALEARGHRIRHPAAGVLLAARDGAEAARQDDLAARYAWPDGLMARVDAAAARDLTGRAHRHGGLWLPRAGTVFPRTLVATLAEGLDLRLGAEVAALRRADGAWSLLDGAGRAVADAGAVVLANGVFARALAAAADLAMTANRGQITLLHGGTAPRAAVSAGAYETPALQWHGAPARVAGATYDRWADPADGAWRRVRDADHRRNLEALADPGTVAGGRAALRAVTTDRLPLVGPLPDAAAYRAAYADLRHGRPAETYPEAPYLPGLYACCGFGSRGLQTAPLAAEVLASLVLGTPAPVETDLLDALHPARFLVRELKKGPQKNTAINYF